MSADVTTPNTSGIKWKCWRRKIWAPAKVPTSYPNKNAPNAAMAQAEYAREPAVGVGVLRTKATVTDICAAPPAQ
jgi:hypothetical protein